MLAARPSFSPQPDPTPERAPSAPAVPEVESLRLLQGQREVLIRHGNDCYRLRHTRNDKLILTK
jgi:hemin uptake protein HemP